MFAKLNHLEKSNFQTFWFFCFKKFFVVVCCCSRERKECLSLSLSFLEIDKNFTEKNFSKTFFFLIFFINQIYSFHDYIHCVCVFVFHFELDGFLILTSSSLFWHPKTNDSNLFNKKNIKNHSFCFWKHPKKMSMFDYRVWLCASDMYPDQNSINVISVGMFDVSISIMMIRDFHFFFHFKIQFQIEIYPWWWNQNENSFQNLLFLVNIIMVFHSKQNQNLNVSNSIRLFLIFVCLFFSSFTRRKIETKAEKQKQTTKQKQKTKLNFPRGKQSFKGFPPPPTSSSDNRHIW